MTENLINTRRQNMTREQLIAELQDAHSEEFVTMFLGYLCGALPELHHIDCPRVLEVWNAYKKDFGK